jgi:hypothetical protein
MTQNSFRSMKVFNCVYFPVSQYRDEIYSITECEEGRGLYLNSIRADLTVNTVLTLGMDKINGSVLLWNCSISGSLCFVLLLKEGGKFGGIILRLVYSW